MTWVAVGALVAQGVGGGMQTAGSTMQVRDQNKKIKNAMSDYPYEDYAGYKPPKTDWTSEDGSAGSYVSEAFPESLKSLITGKSGKDVNTLRAVQALNTNLISNRAQGNDVGYSPEWMKENVDVLNSQLKRREGDQLRTSAGALASQGLGGNPRAYEATSGRIQRNNSEDLANAISALNIADMEKKADQTYGYAGMLQDLNRDNFGQDNKVAEFDLNQWKAEESAKQGRTGLGLEAASMFRSPWGNALSSWGGSLSNMGSSLMGGSGGGSQSTVQPYSSSAQSLSGGNKYFEGYGLQPTSSQSINNNYSDYLSSKSGKKYTF